MQNALSPLSPHRMANYTDYDGQKHLIFIAADGADQKIPRLTTLVSKDEKHLSARELASKGKLRCPENGCKLAVVGVKDWEHQFRHESGADQDCFLNQKELDAESTWQLITKHSLASWLNEELARESREDFSVEVTSQAELLANKSTLQKAPDVLVRISRKPALAVECLYERPENLTYISEKTEMYEQNGVQSLWIFEPHSFITQLTNTEFDLCNENKDQRVIAQNIRVSVDNFYFFDAKRAHLLVPFIRSREFDGQPVDVTEKWPDPLTADERGKALAEKPARRAPHADSQRFEIAPTPMDELALIYRRSAEIRFAIHSAIDREWSEHLAGYDDARKRAVRNRTLALGEQNEAGFESIKNLVDELFAAREAERGE